MFGFLCEFRVCSELRNPCGSRIRRRVHPRHASEEAPSSSKQKEVVSAATEKVHELIPAKRRRRTIKIKTAVRIGKPYLQIIHSHANSISMSWLWD